MPELDPLVAYVHRIQTLEHNIQRTFERAMVQHPEPGKDNLTLDQALMLLVDAYGTKGEEGQKRGLLVGNFRTMFDAYRVQTFSTIDKRNALVQRAQAMAKSKDPDEKEWEQQVLAEARLKRDNENKSTQAPDLVMEPIKPE
ncbi:MULTISPECIES: hypothetical protein [Pseudomonadota]|uniref:hypothetical protein n=1 Tax=Pseudomonadota TaxID=1224 RepID=UPI0026364EC4|nr:MULTISPECIES: hypothetical protein [Pseudomonadota]